MSHGLIVLPDDTAQPVVDAIDGAKQSLRVKMFLFSDPTIQDALAKAGRRGVKERGVKIHVLAKPVHTLKAGKLMEEVGGLRTMHNVGIKVHKLKHLKLDGKMLLADDSRAIVGSINLTPGSFDSRRELAIEVHDADVVERLSKIVTTGSIRIRWICPIRPARRSRKTRD